MAATPRRPRAGRTHRGGALVGGGDLLAVEVGEPPAVGDDPDAVRLHLLDEGVAHEGDVPDLLLLERGHLLVKDLLVPVDYG